MGCGCMRGVVWYGGVRRGCERCGYVRGAGV